MERKFEMREENFQAVHTSVEAVESCGQTVLRVVKTEKILQGDENTYAKLVGPVFHNGEIQVKMLSRLLPDAPSHARGFIGIVFRASEDDGEFESFYVRPTNSQTDDPVRKAHGCQYFSYPTYTFAYFREKGIEKYEAPVDGIALDQWIELKAVVNGCQGEFYVNGTLVLTVDDMKHGTDAQGAVGFYVDMGTEGFFKDLIVTQKG